MCLFEYDQEKHLKDTYEEGVEEGEKIGEARGIEIGTARGEARGIEIGTAQGEKRMACLIQKLVEQNRTEDLVRATKDSAFREQLYLDLQING